MLVRVSVGSIVSVVLAALVSGLTQTAGQHVNPAQTVERKVDPAPLATAPPAPVASGQAKRPVETPPVTIESPPVAKEPVATEPAAGAGLRVFVDPATGEIVEPTETQLAELERLRRADAGVPPQEQLFERPGDFGGFMLEVPASLYPVVVATIGPDDRAAVRHGTLPDAAPAEPATVTPQSEQRVGPRAGEGIELPPSPNVTVTINNGDGAGEGFNDATAVAAVFGNPGTTLGAQRLNVFRAAAEVWGGILKSSVPIQVNAQMNPQTCDAFSAVLGSAGPINFFRDFAGAPVASTWYAIALANSRAGVDLDPAAADINATFNSDVDNPVCLGATSWWYGIGAPAPAGTIDFYTTVLHEIGHGIGVLTLVNLTTGAKALGFDDAYERLLYDVSSATAWPALTDAQRAASALNTGNVVFLGLSAQTAARGFLTAGLNVNFPRVYAPNPLQQGSSISHFDTAASPNELMEPAITAPPGPYAYLTTGLLEDVGWRLMSNGAFSFAGLASKTWVWNPTDSWRAISDLLPENLEPWNGNVVGDYGASGTWLWSGTTSTWSLVNAGNPDTVRACGPNLLWENASGTYRYNPTDGWVLLSGLNADDIHCFGGDMVWESAAGTWIYRLLTGWTKISDFNPVAMRPCGSGVVWWTSGGAAALNGTWFYTAAGWTKISDFTPDSIACWRGQIVWEGAIGTWVYNFATGWTKISDLNPDAVVAWGPTLVWESAAGTWLYSSTGVWSKISDLNPSIVAAFGADLFWSNATSTWVYRGDGWLRISDFGPTKIVSTGVFP